MPRSVALCSLSWLEVKAWGRTGTVCLGPTLGVSESRDWVGPHSLYVLFNVRAVSCHLEPQPVVCVSRTAGWGAQQSHHS